MKLIYATGNPAKLEAMRHRLEPLGIELIGMKELGIAVPQVIEDGKTPLENAEKKARAYFEAFQTPVFSCDSGLYFDEIPEEEQPGVHVRTVDGKYLSDDEMIEHYSKLAQKYGKVTARYKNAICLVLDDKHIYKAMEKGMESTPFFIAEKPHSKIRKPGFPIDSLSIDIRTGKYFYDLEPHELEKVAVEDGFLEFFRRILDL